jgi:hypothetical protein
METEETKTNPENNHPQVHKESATIHTVIGTEKKD